MPEKAKAKPKLKEIGVRHRALVEEYLRNGGVGGDAYNAVYACPTMKPVYRIQEASKILKRPEVKRYKEMLLDDIRHRVGVDYGSLLQDGKRLMLGAEKKSQYKAAVGALGELNKMTGAYAKSTQEGGEGKATLTIEVVGNGRVKTA